MKVPLRLLTQQKSALSAIIRLATSRTARSAPPDLFEREFSQVLAPPSDELIEAYLTHLGIPTERYADTIPPHLFPQWGFAFMIKALIGAPYNLKSALNGGCKLTINSQLPRGEALHVRSRLLEIDDNERRVLLRKEIITGTASNPEALCAETTFIVPRRTKEKSKREKLKIHAEAKRIASWSLPSNAGREFAILTGDINPIHSLPVFAKIAGFKSCILHGFSSFARATETLIEEQASGNPKALAMIEASFTRAIVIPGEIGVYTTETGDFFIGHENGGESFVNGTFSLHPGT